MKQVRKVFFITMVIGSIVTTVCPAHPQGIATMYQEIHSETPQDRQRIKKDMQLENQRINAETETREAEKQKLKQENLAHKRHKHAVNNSVKNTKH